MTDPSESNITNNMKCPVTDRTDVIDDCYITIEFGYGSDKDMMTYNFNTVHDSVGKVVLEAIQSMMPKGRSVDDFGRDTIAENFDEHWWDKLSDEQRADYKKQWGIE
ncbi:MAG: hypothetical protein CMO74_13920 [Verrucomicrobiales bacterium]|nr:hypothetical protein [Verrucomicrobiales bacterium]|tara:strand:- start:151 stop:471 length:321 start_codon:yes stop_codon:yes gene_type:complete